MVDNLIVLYKVVNSEADNSDYMFNAFSMPRGPKGPTLAAVKHNCHALRDLCHIGADGYHWRVCVEDKPGPGEEGSSRGAYTWWDIQDENAVLPVKEASVAQLGKFFSPPKVDNIDSATKAARGAAKNMLKAMAGAVTGNDLSEGPPVPVIAFKLLDLVKMNDDFRSKNPGRVSGLDHSSAGRRTSRPPQNQPAATPPPPVRQPPAATASPNLSYQAPPRPPAPAPRPVPAAAASVPPSAPVQANLMDFAPPTSARGLGRTSSSPASFDGNVKESRAEKLRTEYARKQSSQDLEWDPIEERMVQKGSMKNGSEPVETSVPKAKIVGTSLDASMTIGKSAHVAQAVNKRINDMKQSQDKAISEIREREAKAAQDKAEEEEVRKRLEPRIKTWSEEHGKKKQLRALLGTLHTILWPDSGWTPVSIGDILDDGKVKKVYFKASRIVHPDKATGLDAEKRFLAKRIFDALTQAKVDFDNGTK